MKWQESPPIHGSCINVGFSVSLFVQSTGELEPAMTFAKSSPTSIQEPRRVIVISWAKSTSNSSSNLPWHALSRSGAISQSSPCSRVASKSIHEQNSATCTLPLVVYVRPRAATVGSNSARILWKNLDSGRDRCVNTPIPKFQRGQRSFHVPLWERCRSLGTDQELTHISGI
ncbi:hypothetical protein BR93DRAFT_74999 [Coniochaeta sp. PMI_546]|nr:hypothetical protein BR93DRAFT_74999 [Coniochaeta sp. PMI_546]